MAVDYNIKPSARLSLLMFRFDSPIARISSSLVLYRVLRSDFHFGEEIVIVLLSGENYDTWWYRTPSFFVTMQGVTPLLSWISCAADNGRFWNIHRTHPIWVHAITISSQKWKNHWEGPGIAHDEFMRAIWRSIRNMNKDGRADGVRRLLNIWQNLIKEATLLKLCKCCTLWIKPCQKYRIVANTFYSILVYIYILHSNFFVQNSVL